MLAAAVLAGGGGQGACSSWARRRYGRVARGFVARAGRVAWVQRRTGTRSAPEFVQRTSLDGVRRYGFAKLRWRGSTFSFFFLVVAKSRDARDRTPSITRAVHTCVTRLLQNGRYQAVSDHSMCITSLRRRVIDRTRRKRGLRTHAIASSSRQKPCVFYLGFHPTCTR